MKLLVLVAVLLIICLVMYALFAYLTMQTKRQNRRPKSSGRWEVILEDRNTTTEAWLVESSQGTELSREFFGACDRMAEGYADRLIDLEVAADDRARERNTARKVVGQ